MLRHERLLSDLSNLINGSDRPIIPILNKKIAELEFKLLTSVPTSKRDSYYYRQKKELSIRLSEGYFANEVIKYREKQAEAMAIIKELFPLYYQLGEIVKKKNICEKCHKNETNATHTMCIECRTIAKGEHSVCQTCNSDLVTDRSRASGFCNADCKRSWHTGSPFAIRSMKKIATHMMQPYTTKSGLLRYRMVPKPNKKQRKPGWNLDDN